MLSFPQQPMLAKPVRQLPPADALPGGCVYEPKYDGYRALLFVDDIGCRIQSRRGNDITASFPDIAAAADDQIPAGNVLDGELVVWEDRRLEFAELQRRLASTGNAARRAYQHPATFVAFDLLCRDHRDVRLDTFRDRRAALEDLVSNHQGPPIQPVPQTRDRAEALRQLADYATDPIGIEGLVVKGLDQPYRPGQRDWMKIRVRDTVEVVVGAITGTLTAPHRLVVGQYDVAGKLVIVGGTDVLGGRERRSIAPLLQLPTGEHPWPTELADASAGPGGRQRQSITRVEPRLVVEVSVEEDAGSGLARRVARFVRVRPDLTIEETEVL
jgi:ATP-dependent DNA ligase